MDVANTVSKFITFANLKGACMLSRTLATASSVCQTQYLVDWKIVSDLTKCWVKF